MLQQHLWLVFFFYLETTTYFTKCYQQNSCSENWPINITYWMWQGICRYCLWYVHLSCLRWDSSLLQVSCCSHLKGRLAIKQEQPVQWEHDLQRLMAWLCHATGLWVVNIATQNHQNKFWNWRDVWPRRQGDYEGDMFRGWSAEGRGKGMFGEREQKHLEEWAEWMKFQRKGGIQTLRFIPINRDCFHCTSRIGWQGFKLLGGCQIRQLEQFL